MSAGDGMIMLMDDKMGTTRAPGVGFVEGCVGGDGKDGDGGHDVIREGGGEESEVVGDGSGAGLDGSGRGLL